MTWYESAGATVEGIGIVIEKGQQKGGGYNSKQRADLESLAIIEDMDCVNKTITFR